jgi:hypothetical protein
MKNTRISKKEKMLGSFIPVTPEFMKFVSSYVFPSDKEINKIQQHYKASIVKGMDYALVYMNQKPQKVGLFKSVRSQNKLHIKYFNKDQFKQTALLEYSRNLKYYKPYAKCPKKLKKDAKLKNRKYKLYRIFDLKNNRDISGITVFSYCQETLQRKVVVPN